MPRMARSTPAGKRLAAKMNSQAGNARKGKKYATVVKNGETYHSYAAQNGKPATTVKVPRTIKRDPVTPRLIENRKDATVSTEVNKGTYAPAAGRKGNTFKKVLVGPKGTTPMEYHIYGGAGTGRKRKVFRVPKS